MGYKKFFILLITAILTFIMANYVIWKNFTEDLVTDKYDGGDLTRTGCVYGSKLLRKNSFDLPIKHIEMNDYAGQKVDVLTIGDSFSCVGGGGKNSFYQDYIASDNNFTVLNVFPYPTDDLFMYFQPLSTLSVLYNSGYLDIIKPRYVLIESVVRYSLQRFAKPLDFSTTDSLEKIRANYRGSGTPKLLPGVSFMNDGNLKFLYNNLLYQLSDNAFGNRIYAVGLDRPFFSVKRPKQLLFYREDISNMAYINKDAVKRLNDNFNTVAEILAKKGIKLIYMPIVDKYDLYSDYIVSKRYPRNPYFEYLRQLPKKYMFIDTKAILAEELKKGEKDIYYSDDTHWSWKAEELVFRSVTFN